MAKLLLDHLTWIRQRLWGAGVAPHLLVALDCDGAFDPLVDRPADARLDPATRQSVAALARRPDTTVAIVSAAAVGDLRRRIGLDTVVYAGNHGLEIKGPSFALDRALPTETLRRLVNLAADLTLRLARFPGVVVKYKRLTVGVQYEAAHEAVATLVRHAVQTAFEGLGAGLQIEFGTQGFEIGPRIDWNRAMAIAWVREQLRRPDVSAVYVGDDRADEAVLRGLPGWITVKGGVAEGTGARFYLPARDGIPTFLDWLAATRP